MEREFTQLLWPILRNERLSNRARAVSAQCLALKLDKSPKELLREIGLGDREREAILRAIVRQETRAEGPERRTGDKALDKTPQSFHREIEPADEATPRIQRTGTDGGSLPGVGRNRAKAALQDLLTELFAKRESYKQELIGRLQPALNSYLAIQTPETADEKREIAQEISDTLDPLGLAILVESIPCNLVVSESPSNRLGIFMLRPKGASTAILSRSRLADLLPLQLTEAAPRREALSEWRERSKQSQTHPERTR
jgi:hypothetical protein